MPERGSKERMQRHDKLEQDIMALLTAEGVDVQMAKTALEVCSYKMDEEIRGFLVNTPAAEVVHPKDWVPTA